MDQIAITQKVPLISDLLYRAILSNGPGYEASYLLTSTLLIIPSKLDIL